MLAHGLVDRPTQALGLNAAAWDSLRGRAEEWRLQLLRETPPVNPVVLGGRLPKGARQPSPTSAHSAG